MERIEHVKAIETSLVLVKVAKTAQDEVASLKEQLKVAKMQYSQWADKTEEALDMSKAEVKMLVADGKTLIDRVAAEQAKAKAAQKEVGLYVALLNDAEKKVDYSEMRLNIVSDKYVSQLYDAETEIGTLKAEAGELKTEKIALKALLNAERLKNKMLVESLSKGLAMFEQPPLDNGVQQAAPPDSPWTIFLNGNA